MWLSTDTLIYGCKVYRLCREFGARMLVLLMLRRLLYIDRFFLTAGEKEDTIRSEFLRDSFCPTSFVRCAYVFCCVERPVLMTSYNCIAFYLFIYLYILKFGFLHPSFPLDTFSNYKEHNNIFQT